MLVSSDAGSGTTRDALAKRARHHRDGAARDEAGDTTETAGGGGESSAEFDVHSRSLFERYGGSLTLALAITCSALS